MPRNVHVSGPSDGLRSALEERLQRAGAVITDKLEVADVTIQIDGKDSCDIAIVPYGSEFSNSRIIIELSDVIIPNGGRNWGNGTMTDWVEQIMSGEKPILKSENRFWVNVRDVVDAISILCQSDIEKIPEGRYRMCGRRSWEMEDVIDEIRVLWDRFNNSINHSHTVESLSEIPSPVRGIHSERVEGPELRNIHQVLFELGGEGWHPLVPMRVSLMEMIASAQ